MNMYFGIDGDYIQKDDLVNRGFVFNNQRDFTYEGDKSKFDFVGIIRNEYDDLLAVFPKNYSFSKDKTADAKTLFGLLVDYENLVGNMATTQKSNMLESFPFNQFYYIYEYYERYGLPRLKNKMVKDSYSSRINWKETIRNSKKYINNGKLIMWGTKYDHANYKFSFLADCVIYAVNYTIEKFDIFLELEEIYDEPRMVITQELYPFVLEELYILKNETFIDLEAELINKLIEFFEKISRGYTSFIKTYAFYDIWEAMVEYYVSENNKIIGGIMGSKLNLEKTTFNLKTFVMSAPARRVSKEKIEIDHFYLDLSLKKAYVLDSKYRYEANSLDYKQLFYWIFVRDYLDQNGYSDFEIECCLIFPTDGIEKSNEHIKLSSGIRVKGLDVKEVYLNMNTLIHYYLNR